MRPRLFVLLLAALVITALCAWKTSQPPHASGLRGELPELRQPAPAFALYTHHSPPQIVRLATYLGRHSIVIVFFDGQQGADRSPELLRIRKDFARLKGAGVIVMAITEALPKINRDAMQRAGGFPFPLLTDVTGQVREQWGRVDPQTSRTIPGVFIIDRAGNVAWNKTNPKPVDDFEAAIEDLLQ